MKIRQLIFFGILLICFYVSCDTKHSKKKLIAGSDYKLWLETPDSSKHRGLTKRYWYFDNKGKTEPYVKYYRDSVFSKPNLGDIVLINTWSLKDDSHVIIHGKTYVIDSLSDNTFSFKDTAMNTLTKLIYKGDRLK